MSKSSDNKKPVYLHDALVALQKSFSRLSEKSSDDSIANSTLKTNAIEKEKLQESDRAKAIIIGSVDFEMEFYGKVEGGSDDAKAPIDDRIKISENKDGMRYVLRGTISTDNRIKAEDLELQ